MSTEKSKSDSNQSSARGNQQFDEAIVEPVRAYGALTTDYFEKLFAAQFDAVRAFADTSLAQSRSWLEVKDSDSFRQVIEQQQQAVRELSEKMKEDAEKIRALSQEYLQETQQLTAAGMQKGKEQVENSLQKGKEKADDTQQKSQQQADKGKKSASASHQ
ncbi:phasin family protein [Halomonas sp. LR3S48]|uniref:phasin family protein n=1 Tax=Halomonadaceae TaxID=28256 RepID=UPI0021E45119|nr:phasin family protein [Halomonas sp. LR3S48]UYG03013.1 phasin family protein [Halomonas sp. LR3S48]